MTYDFDIPVPKTYKNGMTAQILELPSKGASIFLPDMETGAVSSIISRIKKSGALQFSVTTRKWVENGQKGTRVWRIS